MRSMPSEELVRYIDEMVHSCTYHPEEARGHTIKQCKGRKKWQNVLIEKYKSGSWIPQLLQKTRIESGE